MPTTGLPTASAAKVPGCQGWNRVSHSQGAGVEHPGSQGAGGGRRPHEPHDAPRHVCPLGAPGVVLTPSLSSLSAVSHSYGYGLLDAGAMVSLAKNWTTVGPQRKCVIDVLTEPK